MHNEADDYKMIDRAAGVAFSNLQRPVVPAWVNKDRLRVIHGTGRLSSQRSTRLSDEDLQ